MNQQVTFSLDEIAEPGARAFSLQTPAGEEQGFVIRFSGEVRAYINSCPHTGINLNWSDEHFFDYAFKFLQCSMHGALFDPLDGLCVRGPCVGKHLTPLPLKLVDRQVIIYS